MSTTSLLLGVALLGVAFCMLSVVLSNNKSRGPEIEGPAAESIEGRPHAAQAASRDRDFDHKPGKVAGGEYTVAPSTPPLHAAEAGEAVDRARVEVEQVGMEVEAEVSLARQGKPPAAGTAPANGSSKPKPTSQEAHAAPLRFCSHCGADVRPGDRFCRGCGGRVHTGCPGCGEPVDAGDRFCRACGTALKSSPSPSAE